MTPTAAIAAIGATFRYVRLATETPAPVAALSGAHIYRDVIDKCSGLHRNNAIAALFCRLDRLDADHFAVLLELNRSLFQREKREIAAAANILARMELRPALTHENRSRLNQLTVKPLYATALRITVTTVSC